MEAHALTQAASTATGATTSAAAVNNRPAISSEDLKKVGTQIGRGMDRTQAAATILTTKIILHFAKNKVRSKTKSREFQKQRSTKTTNKQDKLNEDKNPYGPLGVVEGYVLFKFVEFYASDEAAKDAEHDEFKVDNYVEDYTQDTDNEQNENNQQEDKEKKDEDNQQSNNSTFVIQEE